MKPPPTTARSAGGKWLEPPPGPPWDEPIERAAMAFVDLEMTGLSTADRVIEICIDRVEGGVSERFSILVRPDDGTFGNEHVHGISLADLQGAPLFADVADRVANLLSGAALIAHGATYDVAFLEAEFARAGRALRIPHFLDTLTLARRVYGFRSHALAALAAAFELTPARAHRAADDVHTLRAIFDRTVAQLRPRTLRDVWHVKVGAKSARPQVLENLVTACDQGIPVTVRYRPSGKPPTDYRMVVTKVRSELDPPQVLGYLLPGRGRRELRADRILSVSFL
ncbi:MAG: 3'-5' exonuclease [Polyangiaceae bacterium]